jgi:hypothetical protein
VQNTINSDAAVSDTVRHAAGGTNERNLLIGAGGAACASVAVILCSPVFSTESGSPP